MVAAVTLLRILIFVGLPTLATWLIYLARNPKDPETGKRRQR